MYSPATDGSYTKKEIFGDISVIAVGDLFQLKPVMDSYIFMSPTSGYLPLATNLWNENFNMFELHQIMRQAENKSFAELLNRIREGNQTDDDIAELKNQIIDVNPENYPWEVPRLFTTNEKVDSYNTSIIHRSSNAVYTIKAKDKFVGSAPLAMKLKILENFKNNREQTKQPSSILEVSVGVYYELTATLDTLDVLINGASCKMVKVELADASSYASGRFWVQFNDAEIGRQLRKENKRYYKSYH